MKPSRAVMTIVRDEAIFLPIWLGYYGQFFAPEDIYVLDHGSTDGSTDGGGFVREPVEHEFIDHSWMRNILQARQHQLLERYDAVLVIDVDEIVVPHPRLGTLGDYIDRFEGDFVNCNGHEVLHQKDTEGPYDPTRPIFHQRGWWFWNPAYSKPALARVPMKWVVGFHAPRDGSAHFDDELYLVHLHRFDYQICRDRHLYRSGRAWSDRDLTARRGYQNRITEEEEFERWFYQDSCLGPMPIRPKPIPPELRDSL